MSADDLVYLPYSSGTTGLPKGVMISHRNLVANLCQIRAVQRVRPGDVVLAALPWFHIFGQLTMNLALRDGATIVTMPRFELTEFLRLVQAYRVTLVHVVPPIVLALAKQPAVADYDTSSLRLICLRRGPARRRAGPVVRAAAGLQGHAGLRHDRVRHEPRRAR